MTVRRRQAASGTAPGVSAPAGGATAATSGAAGGEVLLGRYALDEQIGRGGMATVYRAMDTTLGRPVAVKVLHPRLCEDGGFAARFVETERRVAGLSHPHVVTIYDAGHAGGKCFVVMEDLAGGDLRRRVAASGPPPLAESVRLVAEVADALQHLHDNGLVHGDVKPDNVLLDERGRARLADIGIAHLIRGSGGAGGADASSAGTAGYLAPEQIEGRAADARSDVYALGLLAYWLIAGREAYESEHWVAAAAQRLVRDPAPLPAVRADVPAGIASAVSSALACDPAARPSAAAFRDALLSADLTDPAGAAGPPGRSSEADTTALVDPRAALMSRRRADETGLFEIAGAGAHAGPRTALAGRRLPRLRSAFTVPSGPRWDTAGARVRALAADFRRLERPLQVALLAAFGLALFLVVGFAARAANPPRMVTAGSLAGKDVEAARAAAGQLGVQLRVVETPSDTAPKGQIVRQEPPPDTGFASNRPLTVYVSSGPPPVKVPDLRSRRLEDAKKDLEAAGLALGKVHERETPRQPWGAVLDQGTRPGDLKAPGTPVDLAVSAPPYTNVPEVVGKSIGDAEAELQKRGLRISEVRQEAIAGKRAGTVVAQDAAGGVRIRMGEAVTVTIAVPPAPPAPQPKQ